jgi:hypothetical protein
MTILPSDHDSSRGLSRQYALLIETAPTPPYAPGGTPASPYRICQTCERRLTMFVTEWTLQIWHWKWRCREFLDANKFSVPNHKESVTPGGTSGRSESTSNKSHGTWFDGRQDKQFGSQVQNRFAR